MSGEQHNSFTGSVNQYVEKSLRPNGGDSLRHHNVGGESLTAV